MDYNSLNQIIIIRLLERIIAVIVGPMAIYFGYKLFLLLPTQNDSSGKITLPGFSVVLAKVGPGIFFAAFGSILVYQSITNPVVIETPQIKVSGAVELSTPSPQLNLRGISGSIEKKITPQEFEMVRQALQMLNCIETIAVESDPGIHKEDTEEPMRLAKIALLGTIWNEKDWGKKEDFEKRVTMGIGKISDDLKRIYSVKLPGCPK